MARADGFEVEGTVVEALANGLYRVELANGHRLLAHFTGAARRQPPVLAPGAKVGLVISPFDLSKGRIVSNAT
jgi:translation initiation factor IF-1